MSDLLEILKDAEANNRPYPFARIDGTTAVAPVYAVHAHDVTVLMLEISNRDARIAELELAAKWEGDLAQQALDDLKKRDTRIAELESRMAKKEVEKDEVRLYHAKKLTAQYEVLEMRETRIAELEAENAKLKEEVERLEWKVLAYETR